jgi:hypothetical protein
MVIMRWTGDSWRITPTPSLPGCPAPDGVAANSRVDAWAVGVWSSCGNGYSALVEHYH